MRTEGRGTHERRLRHFRLACLCTEEIYPDHDTFVLLLIAITNLGGLIPDKTPRDNPSQPLWTRAQRKHAHNTPQFHLFFLGELMSLVGIFNLTIQ